MTDATSFSSIFEDRKKSNFDQRIKFSLTPDNKSERSESIDSILNGQCRIGRNY
jgi:hypothetical protein